MRNGILALLIVLFPLMAFVSSIAIGRHIVEIVDAAGPVGFWALIGIVTLLTSAAELLVIYRPWEKR